MDAIKSSLYRIFSGEIDIEKDKNMTIGVGVALSACIFIFVMWAIINSEISENENKNNDSNAEKKQNEPRNEDDILQNLLDRQKEDVLWGRTDKYEWKQTESEIDLYLFVARNVTSKDVDLVIKSQSFCLKIKEIIWLEGVFNAEVIPSECNWQLNITFTDQVQIEINLVKKMRTQRNGHWKCVFQGEKEVDTSVLGPAIHAINPQDPKSIRSALAMMNNLKK